MPGSERLFLLDGMALAYRAYFALISRPLINSKGINTSAVYGFTTALMKILEDEKPDHIAVVFDTREPTFRHKMFEPYKATRQKMPEDMASQMDMLKEVVRAFNTPLVEVPGYEADDVIGTLARQAEHEEVEVYMVTGDKDFMQLISQQVRMYKPGKAGGEAEIVDAEGVRAKFGVAPQQVTDVLALIGDKSDNVPGVPGIGEKTAIPLIQQYGGLDQLYANVESIPQKGVREKLKKNRESAFLSRDLVTIRTDVPLDVDFHHLRATPRDTPRLMKLFGELEFRSLAGRLRDTEQWTDTPAGNLRDADIEFNPEELSTVDIRSDQHSYQCIRSEDELSRLCEEIRGTDRIVVDTETTSADPMRAELVGISLSLREREACYIPIRYTPRSEDGSGLFHDDPQAAARNHTLEALELPTIVKHLKPLLENPRIGKVGQNVKYDLLVLRNHGIEMQGTAFDTMVASYVLRADGQHNLDALAMEHLGYRMMAYEDVVGKGKDQKKITEAPLALVADYSAEDADMTMRVFASQSRKLEELELLHLCETVEFPLIRVLADMEYAGVALDVPYLREMSKDLERQLDGLVTDIHALAGESFNINSTQQLGEILFNVLKLPTVRKTKTGFSTDVNVLEALRGQHPIIEKLLEYRQFAKLKSTYVDALPELIHPRTGRVHTSYNQTVAATGRLSSSDPNLQNIPIRTEFGRAIRKAFIPGSDDTVLISADYSQIELRVMAHISGDEGLVEAFRNAEDIHASTAAKVFGAPADEVTRDMRRKAKEVNFGIMYGIGPYGLATRLEITQTEAKEIIERYFQRFPKVQQYIQDTIAVARSTGYVSTLMGRRRYLPEIVSRNHNVRSNAERQAINMPIQGTAADMIKLAMIQIHQELLERGLATRMILQVHDELVFEGHTSETETARDLIIRRMQTALPLSVPVEVDIGIGHTWLEAH